MASAAPAYEERGMSIGRVFQRAFATIAHNPSVVLGLVVLLGVLPSVLFSYLANLTGTFDWTGAHGPVNWAVVTLSWVISIVIAAVLQGALIRATVEENEGRHSGFAECVAAGFRVCLPLFVVDLIFLIAMTIGFVLLIVPGILVMVVWSLAAPAVAVERGGIMRSFGRSAELTKGHRWKIFGLFLILAAIYAVEFVVFAEVGMVTMTPPPSGQMGPLNIIANVITSLVFNLLWGTIQPALYVELRQSGEGGSPQDLEQVFA